MIFSENKVPYDASTMRDIEEGLIIAEGEKPKFIQKNITENGTYRASSDNVDGYSSVVANVPNTYSLSDEGKVVNEGNLVAQSAYPTEITENDTYDTTNYNSITVNVSSGDSPILDGKTRYYYTIPSDELSVSLKLQLDEDTELDIDWGDNTEHTTWISEESLENKSHNYSAAGEYVVTITPISGSFSPGTSFDEGNRTLRRVVLGNNVSSINNTAFYDYVGLSSIFISDSVRSIYGSAFNNCCALSSLVIPSSVNFIDEHFVTYCNALQFIKFESSTPPTVSSNLEIPNTCIIKVPQGTLSDYTSASNYPDPSEYIYEEY